MTLDLFRDLPALDEVLESRFNAAKGSMARVLTASSHMVTVEVPGPNGWDGPLGPYPATVLGLTTGAAGVLMPLRGDNYLFIPVGGTLPEHTHFVSSGGGYTAIAEGTTYGGDNTALVAVGNFLGDLTDVDRSTILGSFIQGSGALGSTGLVAIGHWLGGVAQDAIAIGNNASAPYPNGVAIGFGAGTADDSIAIGRDAGAQWWGVAIGRDAESGPQGVAIGFSATASGSRSIAIGNGASEATDDTAKIKANDLIVERSNGTGASRLVLYSATGVFTYITVISNRLWVGGTPHIVQGDHPSTVHSNNRKVGGTAAALKSYPADAAGGVTMPAGHQFFVNGSFYASPYNWYSAYSPTYGWGYIRQDQTVAL